MGTNLYAEKLSQQNTHLGLPHQTLNPTLPPSYDQSFCDANPKPPNYTVSSQIKLCSLFSFTQKSPAPTLSWPSEGLQLGLLPALKGWSHLAILTRQQLDFRWFVRLHQERLEGCVKSLQADISGQMFLRKLCLEVRDTRQEGSMSKEWKTLFLEGYGKYQQGDKARSSDCDTERLINKHLNPDLTYQNYKKKKVWSRV